MRTRTPRLPRGLLQGLPLVLLLAGCAESRPTPVSMAPPPVPFAPPAVVLIPPTPQGFVYCVPYAREVTGVELFGDAWTWWQGAADHYARGSAPAAGAILVFKRTDRLQSGHVSVVTQVVSPREIRVTHANWGYAGKARGQVDRDVPVIDVSPNNDWSEVRVWNGGSYGREYPAYGFVYPGGTGQAI